MDFAKSLPERLELCGDGIAQSLECGDPETSLLFLAAASKWLREVRQLRTASLVEFNYKALSKRLSGGLTPDLLGVSKNKDLKDDVPHAWSQRSIGLISLATELSFNFGITRMRRILRPGKRSKRLTDQELQVLTQIFVRYMGELKGPLMKVGQQLSYLGLDLGIQGNEILRSLQDESAPISPECIRETVELELGKKLSDVFLSFESQPIGIGSIGQVHRARLKSGEEVAVKIQYPKIKEAIASDLKTLRILIPVIKTLFPRLINEDIAGELEAMLLEECDYVREARSLERFHAIYSGLEGIRIPKTYPLLCTACVLTMEWVEGKTFKEFVDTSTNEKKSRAAESIAYFFTRGAAEGYFMTDPLRYADNGC